MPASVTRKKTSMRLPANLDAGTVKPVHEQLLSLLEQVEVSEIELLLELEPGDVGVSPLSLQLIASAARSFPGDRLMLGAPVAAALATLERPKEI